MPAVQRQGDANSAGGVASSGVASVRVNGRPVVVPGISVTPHPYCGWRSTPNQKYSTNMIVVIEPYTWTSDVYDEVVAIILEYDYTEKDCKVLSFGSSIEDVIPKENIKKHIRCPEDGEYFGTAPNHSMKFNGEKNIWESVSEDKIIKDRDIIINEKTIADYII